MDSELEKDIQRMLSNMCLEYLKDRSLKYDVIAEDIYKAFIAAGYIQPTTGTMLTTENGV